MSEIHLPKLDVYLELPKHISVHYNGEKVKSIVRAAFQLNRERNGDQASTSVNSSKTGTIKIYRKKTLFSKKEDYYLFYEAENEIMDFYNGGFEESRLLLHFNKQDLLEEKIKQYYHLTTNFNEIIPEHKANMGGICALKNNNISPKLLPKQYELLKQYVR